MKICENVHQLRIDFHVTAEIQRYVYVYILTGEFCYLIDTGVHGSERVIEDYLHHIGYQIEDIKGIFLTHAHPDHMGSAAAIQKRTSCLIYASVQEKEWIEDIERQYNERPIPNFYKLLQNSAHVNNVIEKNMTIELEENMTISILQTPGHSKGSLSFLYNQHILFVGDAIPVIDDIPIYTNIAQSIQTLKVLNNIDEIHYYCPAWDCVYQQETGRIKIKAALQFIERIDHCVLNIFNNHLDISQDELFERVCDQMNMHVFKQNPLFKQTILAYVDAKKS